MFLICFGFKIIVYIGWKGPGVLGNKVPQENGLSGRPRWKRFHKFLSKIVEEWNIFTEISKIDQILVFRIFNHNLTETNRKFPIFR